MKREEYINLITPAMELVIKKDQDYNSNIERRDYFPFGDVSYVQMLHVKVMRLRNLVESGKKPNFESVHDTVLDLLNYTVFYLDFLEHKEG